MYVVVLSNGAVRGPFITLDKAREECIGTGGRIYLLQGPVQ